MRKSLTQIAFDFGGTEQPQEKKPQMPQPPKEETAPATDVPVNEISEPSPVMAKPPIETPVRTKEPRAKNKRGRRSLKEIALHSDLIQVPEDEILFQKQYYSIGEVARMFRENQSLIRYWETEFDILKPRKNRKGDRFFRPADIKNLQLIYDLLRRRKFTIEGAREYLKKNRNADEKFAMIQSLQKIRGFLLELKASL